MQRIKAALLWFRLLVGHLEVKFNDSDSVTFRVKNVVKPPKTSFVQLLN